MPTLHLTGSACSATDHRDYRGPSDNCRRFHNNAVESTVPAAGDRSPPDASDLRLVLFVPLFISPALEDACSLGTLTGRNADSSNTSGTSRSNAGDCFIFCFVGASLSRAASDRISSSATCHCNWARRSWRRLPCYRRCSVFLCRIDFANHSDHFKLEWSGEVIRRSVWAVSIRSRKTKCKRREKYATGREK